MGSVLGEVKGVAYREAHVIGKNPIVSDEDDETSVMSRNDVVDDRDAGVQRCVTR